MRTKRKYRNQWQEDRRANRRWKKRKTDFRPEIFDRIFKVNIWDDVFFGQESCLKASQRISCPDSEIASWHGINVRISVLFSSFSFFPPLAQINLSRIHIGISYRAYFEFASFSFFSSSFLSLSLIFYPRQPRRFKFKSIVRWKRLCK